MRHSHIGALQLQPCAACVLEAFLWGLMVKMCLLNLGATRKRSRCRLVSLLIHNPHAPSTSSIGISTVRYDTIPHDASLSVLAAWHVQAT